MSEIVLLLPNTDLLQQVEDYVRGCSPELIFKPWYVPGLYSSNCRVTPLQVKWSVPYRKLSLNINKSFYSSSQVLAPNQHIQKHKFDWFDVTRQLLEYNPGTYQGLKMSSVEQPLT
jgi:hypothetical protein